MKTVLFNIAQIGSFLELYFALRGRNEKFGTQEKMPTWCKLSLIGPRLYCSLICIIIINTVFFANVNLEDVTSLCAILFLCACVFVHIGSIL